MKGNQEWKYDHKVSHFSLFTFLIPFFSSLYAIVPSCCSWRGLCVRAGGDGGSFQKSQLLHKVTNKCLEMTKDGARLQMRPCDTSNEYQQWVFKEYDEAKAREHGML